MFGEVGRRIHAWFIPSRHNDFHPHVLAERGLLLLFALILGAEGFLISNVVSTEVGTPALAWSGMGGLAAVGSANVSSTILPPIITEWSNYWSVQVIEPLSRLSMQPGAGRIAFLTIACMAAVLMGLLAYMLSVRRRHYQPVGYIAGGTMLLFASTFLFVDIQYLLPGVAASRDEAAAAAAQVQASERPASTSGQSENVATSTAQAVLLGKIDLSTSTNTAILTR